MVVGEQGPVPCAVWLPSSPAGAPLLLLGHGGSGGKRCPRNERLGRWFAAHGVAALAIDGPFHGDRVAAPLPAAEYQRQMLERGVPAVIAAWTKDWLLAVDCIAWTHGIDGDRCAYLGLSLGSRVGIPLAAELGSRLRCAVFGKFGLVESPLLPDGLATPVSTRAAAQRIAAPTLLVMRWDDELFPRAGVLELFDAFAAVDKTLVARSGVHAGTHPDDEPSWCAFVLRHLLP